MTLLEMLITVAVASILLAGLMSGWLFTTRSMLAVANYGDLDRRSQNALDNMTRDIRGACSITAASNNSLTCSNLDGSTFTYAWNPSTQLVTKTQGSQTTVFLSGCTYLCFSTWLRVPTNQFWFPYPATNQLNIAKLVNVSWRCKRTMLNQYNTESVQTAKIVLRN